MRFLVDECLGELVVTKLRDRGHDVEWVRELASGISDEAVLEWSVQEARVLVTEDFDFGDLIFAKGLAAYAVVILQTRDFSGTWDEVASEVARRLDALQGEVLGRLTTLGRTRAKSRPLPSP